MRSILKYMAAVVVTIASFTSAAFGQDKYPVPEQQITGADKPVPLGDLVFLSLSKIEKDKVPASYVKYSVTWRVIDGGKERTYYTSEDGSIFFGTGLTKRTVTVTAAVGYLYVERKDGKTTDADVRTALLTKTVQLGDGTPPPPPPPDPDVDPTFPDGKYKLSATTWKLVKDKVPGPAKAAAPALAQSFRNIKTQIVAGRFQKVEEMLKETTASNRKAVEGAGVTRAEWDPFFTEFMEITFKLYSDKKLVKLEDFAMAWDEVADALDKVKVPTTKEGK